MPNTKTLAARLQKLIATAPSPPVTPFNTTLSRAVVSAPNSATAAADGTPEKPGRSDVLSAYAFASPM